MGLTLKEVFLKEATIQESAESTPVQELEKYTRRNVSSMEDVRELSKQYELFDDVLEFVAMEVSTKTSPEEEKYKKSPEVHSFFKHLLSKAKRFLRSGEADYDQLPGVGEYNAMLMDFYSEREKGKEDMESVHGAMDDYVAGMSPEKQADRQRQKQDRFGKAMSAGEYGKLD